MPAPVAAGKKPKRTTVTPAISEIHSRAVLKVVAPASFRDPSGTTSGSRRRRGTKTTNAPRATVRICAVVEAL